MTQQQTTSSAKSQCAGILAYLQAGNELTPVEAQVTFGCFRLAARIKDLKDRGHHIVTTIKTNPGTGAKYASYRLLPALRIGSKVRLTCLCHEGMTGNVVRAAASIGGAVGVRVGAVVFACAPERLEVIG